MRYWLIILICLLCSCAFPVFSFSQETTPPLVKNNFNKVTSYDELSSYVNLLDAKSDILSVEVIGQSVERRNLYALMFSSTEFGESKSKIKVLVFAQQHGNEQSARQIFIEVSMDVHEYSSYSEELKKHGYRKNSDIMVDAVNSIMNPD